ncbi:MAG: SRPBCC family protein [Chloroflexota bacterium]
MAWPTLTTTFHVAVRPEIAFDELLDVRSGFFGRHVVNSGIDQVPDGPIKIGTEFQVRRWKRPWATIRVVDLDRPRRLVMDTILERTSSARTVFVFDPEGTGTRVRTDTVQSPIWSIWLRPVEALLMRLVMPIARSSARRSSREMARDIETCPRATRDAGT